VDPPTYGPEPQPKYCPWELYDKLERKVHNMENRMRRLKKKINRDTKLLDAALAKVTLSFV
jgi:hypothetical protein